MRTTVFTRGMGWCWFCNVQTAGEIFFTDLSCSLAQLETCMESNCLHFLPMETRIQGKRVESCMLGCDPQLESTAGPVVQTCPALNTLKWTRNGRQPYSLPSYFGELISKKTGRCFQRSLIISIFQLHFVLSTISESHVEDQLPVKSLCEFLPGRAQLKPLSYKTRSAFPGLSITKIHCFLPHSHSRRPQISLAGMPLGIQACVHCPFPRPVKKRR